MKRTPLKRKTPLTSRAQLATRRPLQSKTGIESRQKPRLVSEKRQRALNGVGGYTAFSKALRAAFPTCQIRWGTICTGQTQGVHHVIKLSHAGALRPGPLADAQGQVFIAACNPCNSAVEQYPIDARLSGLVKDNPLDPTALETAILVHEENDHGFV